MSTVLDILSKNKEKGIRIGLDASGNNLSIKGDLSRLETADKIQLRDSKELIIAFLENQKATVNLIDKTELLPGERIDLTPGQKSIWLHSKIEENNALYLIPAVYEFGIPEFKEELLKMALLNVVTSNDVLSFVFNDLEGEPYQEQRTIDIEEHLLFENIENLDEGQQMATIENYIQKSMQFGFEIEKVAPWSITVFQLGNEKYKFFLKVHHLIADGKSLELLISELIKSYTAIVKNETYSSSFVQYHDYVNWITNKENFTSSSAFWKEYLADYTDTNEFSWANEQKDEGGEYTTEFDIKKSLETEIRQFLKQSNISLFSLYTFAFGVVQSKYRNTDDLVIGTPSESRNHPQLGTILGDLVNTLPVRLQFDFNDSVSNQLTQFGNQFLKVLDHQLYPFEFILNDLNFQHKPNDFPLFNTMISFPNNQSFGKRDKNEMAINKAHSMYDLTCSVVQYDDTIVTQFEFNPNRFSKQIVLSIGEQMMVVIEQIINDSNLMMKDISLLSSKGVDFSLKKGKAKAQTTVNHESVLDLIGLFLDDKTSIAVKDERKISYFELWNKSRCFAGYLFEQGCKKGSRVLVELPAGENLIVAMLGCWMANCIYVPISGDLPELRKQKIQEDCDAKVLINIQFDFTTLDTSLKDLELPSPSDLAYIIYTSGSTGKPKGVMVTHGALVNKMVDETALLGLKEDLVTCTLTSPSFDVSLLEIVLPLTSKGKVVIAQNLKEINTIVQSIVEEGVTVLQGTPTYFGFFEAELNDAQASSLNTCLKTICIGGESLNQKLVNRLKRKLPSVTINNHYGPTEITIDALVKQDVKLFENNSIGKPIGNTPVFILDAYQNLLPEMIFGEIVIGGQSLADGYWNDKQMTSEKFVFSEKLQEQVYFTGDFGAWSTNDEVIFRGRIDEQVKYRGYRIELEDINSALREFSNVDDAFSDIQGNSLISWVVSKDAIKDNLMENLRLKLPSYMLPTAIVKMDSLPLSVNGKVDRKKLLQPESLSIGYISPRNELEKEIAEIWKGLLHIEKIGVHDNFFELGGHSLILFKLNSAYQKKFDVRIDLKSFFEKNTIEEHTVLISSSKPQAYKEIKIAPEQAVYPISNGQLRLWTLSQTTEVSVAYNIPFWNELNSEYDVELVQQALRKTVKRHDILRTRFILDDDNVVKQVITPSDSFETLVECRRILKEELQQHIEALTLEPFDLENGPLFKLVIFELDSGAHVLYYCMHHSISDGWSMDVLQSDVIGYYEELATGVEYPPLRIQFKDYVMWQLNQTSTEEYALHKSYWLENLSGNLPLVQLPIAKKRPVFKTSNGQRLSTSIDKSISAQLKSFATQEGGSLFINLLALVNTTLYRYTGQDDLIIGVPVAGREHPDLENQIGFYVNSLAIRTSVEKDVDFRNFFHQQKEVLLNGYKHQDYPFDRIVEEIDLNKDLSRSPLFDIMVSYTENDGTLEEPLKQIVDLGYMPSKFDLEFIFDDKSEHINFAINYNSDLFDSASIEKLMEHFKHFAQNAMSFPDQKIDAIQFQTAEEITEALKVSKGISLDYPTDKSFIELFEEKISTYGDYVATRYKKEEYTYNSLNELANQFGHYLQEEYDVQPDQLVGIELPKDEWMLISILGILKSGAAYVPIDPNYPQERIDYIREDSGCKLIIDADELEKMKASRQKYSRENCTRLCTEKSLAYVIYTSGSTGKPKGVMVENQALLNLCYWHNSAFGITENDKASIYASVAFDAFVWEFFPYLLQGASVSLIPEELRLEMYELNEFFEANQISIAFLPTPIGQQFVATDNNSLRYLLLGGEQLTTFSSKRYRIVNNYGPTEATVVATSTIISSENQITIGKPISNTSVYILDKVEQIVPVGMLGELYVAGDGLARGYLNQPELTAEKFVENPYDKGKRLYRTGDFGRWLPNGNIEFIGRIDNQIKIRGNRIELGEIQVELKKHHDIKEALVLVTEPISGGKDKVIVAYYVATDELDPTELKLFLEKTLPAFMIPQYLVSVSHFPITVNGKIDTKQLPPYTDLDGGSQVEYVAPITEREKSLVSIWQEILGQEKVGIHDDFFKLGGHSLKAVLLINKIKKDLGLSLSIKSLFTFPTISRLIDELKDEENSSIPKAEERESYPTTSSQKRLWLLSQFEGGNNAYNIPIVIDFKGALNTNYLEQAFNLLIDRHESLRTSFKETNEGEIHQFILPKSEVKSTFESIVISGTEADDYIQEFCAREFNLEEAPLLRGRLIATAPDAYCFVLAIHHIISDGWSMEILTKELTNCYNKLLSGSQLNLEELEIQYKDYSSWINSKKYRKQLGEQEEYWLEQFKEEVPKLILPEYKARPLIKTFNGNSINHGFTTDRTADLIRFSKDNGQTMFTVLMSSINALLYRYTNRTDLVIGTPVAGRTHSSLENQIGLYLNTLAIRTKFTADATFSDLLQIEKDVLVDSYANQDFPFDALVEKLNLKIDTSKSALFDVMMVFQSHQNITLNNELGLNGVEAKIRGAESTVSQFDLTFSFSLTQDVLSLNVEFNTDIYEERQIRALVNHLDEFVSEAIKKPEQKLGEINYLSKEEVDTLLVDCNDTQVDFDTTMSIIDMFKRQVSSTPGNTAIIYEDVSLTYRELDERSSQFANYLIGLDAIELASNPCIAIKLDRSDWLMTCILAILKVGATYVPIDPEFPEERIAYMKKDSACVLTVDADLVNAFKEGEYDSGLSINIEKGASKTACIIYTSGSTGEPKGVLTSHINITSLVSGISFFPFNEETVFLSSASISFDATFFEYYGTLFNGGTLVFIEKQMLLDTARLEAHVNKLEVNSLWLTSSLFNSIVDINIKLFKNIKYLIIGGDRVSSVYTNRLLKFNPEIMLTNGYGPTENTTFSTYFRIVEIEKNSPPIGRPIQNRTAYVLSPEMSLLPLGVEGELYVGGKGVSSGYLNSPEKTKNHFVPAPLGINEMLYKTGDRVKWNWDLEIEFIGRADNQVKINGFRVEIEEVRNKILAIDKIDSAHVLYEEIKGVKRLIAFVKTDSDNEEIIPLLKQKMPYYMIPELIRVEQFILNRNGKVDGSAMLELAKKSSTEHNIIDIDSITTSQREIYDVWVKILGHNQFDLEGNFFEVGGTSLLIMKMQKELANSLNKEISIAELFKVKNLIELDEILNSEVKEETEIKRRQNRLKQRR